VASITYRTNKSTGQVYAYQSESFRDPITKKVKTKQQYLGIFDKQSGQIVSSLKNNINKTKINHINSSVVEYFDTIQTFNSKIVGPYMILDNICQQLSIANLLKIVFPTIYTDILSLVYYIVQIGDPLSNIGPWSKLYDHPSQQNYTSQCITKLLDKISSDQIDLFLNLWLKKFINTEYFCYDITSISSYNKSIDFVKRGYNRDHENLPQINLALIFGQQSKLPVYYRRIPGNIVDVQTLDSTIKHLDLLGIKGVRFILDRGFYSQQNVDTMLSRIGTHFTLAAPVRRKWVEKIIDEYSNRMCTPDNHYLLEDDEFIYAKSQLYKWSNSRRRLYLHLYYNDFRAVTDHNNFINELKAFKDQLERNNFNLMDDNYFLKYFNIKNTPIKGLSISYNNDMILEYKNKYAGYFCILSTFIKDPIEALNVYRHKDVVEKCFDDIKNDIDLDRIRVHTTSRMDSKIFLHFLAVIFISKIRNMTAKDNKLKNYSTKMLLNNMGTLQQANIKGSYKKFFTETDKLQNSILEFFGLSWPT
jgi:transposase